VGGQSFGNLFRKLGTLLLGIGFCPDVTSGETVACAYKDFPDHLGFFLPLAGISTVRQISENAFDIRATSRLNRLYVQLLKENAEWGTTERRHDMNHFMACLIFCFFAEDTGIFFGGRLFTDTIAQMSARDSSNTHEVIGELFRAMNTKIEDRANAKLPRWADAFPYVNGDLFSGSFEVPRFSKIARSYLLHIGSLDWTKINPDIFGSMIQAVAEDEERGVLGFAWTCAIWLSSSFYCPRTTMQPARVFRLAKSANKMSHLVWNHAHAELTPDIVLFLYTCNPTKETRRFAGENSWKNRPKPAHRLTLDRRPRAVRWETRV